MVNLQGKTEILIFKSQIHNSKKNLRLKWYLVRLIKLIHKQNVDILQYYKDINLQRNEIKTLKKNLRNSLEIKNKTKQKN